MPFSYVDEGQRVSNPLSIPELKPGGADREESCGMKAVHGEELMQVLKARTRGAGAEPTIE